MSTTGAYRVRRRTAEPDVRTLVTKTLDKATATAHFERHRDTESSLWIELQRWDSEAGAWVVADWFGVKLVEV